MRMETLREFTVFARHLNFSTAARELNLSQSTLSTHIAALEKELRLPLVQRKGGVALADVGKAFLGGIQEVTSRYDRTLDDCRALMHAYPAVKVKTTGTIGFLPDLLEHANVIPFDLVEIPMEALPPFAELARGLVDVATYYDCSFSPELSGQARELGVAFQSIGRDPVRICVTRKSPHFEKERLDRTDLKGASIAVASNKWFDFMVTQIRHLLGDEHGELGLDFRMMPIASPLALRYLDIGDAVMICATNYQEFCERSDVRAFDALDGELLHYEQTVAFKADNPNPNVRALVEAFAR